MAAVPKIDGEMRVSEVIALFPQAADIMAEYGLHCFSCHMGGAESLDEGCQIHGFTPEMTVELIDDINRAIAEVPARAQDITVTSAAAKGIRDIAEQEKRKGQILRIEVDATGGFCLEFTDAALAGDSIFVCNEDPETKVCASALTLHRIGGATIDMREGRFKLDLPEDLAQAACGCEEGGCHC